MRVPRQLFMPSLAGIVDPDVVAAPTAEVFHIQPEPGVVLEGAKEKLGRRLRGMTFFTILHSRPSRRKLPSGVRARVTDPFALAIMRLDVVELLCDPTGVTVHAAFAAEVGKLEDCFPLNPHSCGLRTCAP
jgi:hypothetical protein